MHFIMAVIVQRLSYGHDVWTHTAFLLSFIRLISLYKKADDSFDNIYPLIEFSPPVAKVPNTNTALRLSLRK